MEFEERKKMRKEEISKLLIQLGKTLEEKGALDFGKGEISIPESVEVELEYKEKPDKGKFEIELKWIPSETKVTAVPTEAKPSIKDLMRELSTEFSNINRTIRGGVIPAIEQFAKFEGLVTKCESCAKPEWKKEMINYSQKVGELKKAIIDKNMDEIKRLSQVLAKLSAECHLKYK
ncbi:MAG: amphi-Trp domain-containing protein [Euryarchaeota archaeon]|nr:amphi-Trp domain-containing protein [Euryarchaeota archaeon]